MEGILTYGGEVAATGVLLVLNMRIAATVWSY